MYVSGLQLNVGKAECFLAVSLAQIYSKENRLHDIKILRIVKSMGACYDYVSCYYQNLNN